MNNFFRSAAIVRIALLRLTLFFFGLFFSCFAFSAQYKLSHPHQSVVGHLQFYQIQGGERFGTLARQFDVGYNELIVANPRIDPSNLIVGQVLIIPTQYVLPERTFRGIVVNIPEKRLYYYPKNRKKIYTFPVGVGRNGWPTPIGDFFIMQKKKNPYWIVPVAVRHDHDLLGRSLPVVVRPGMNNPLGSYLLRLSLPTYLIHGTNQPFGVGQRSTAGCMSMYPEDVEKMFSLIEEKTRVKTIDQPIKLALDRGFWIEISDYTVDDKLAWPGSELYGNQALRDRGKLYDDPFAMVYHVAKSFGVKSWHWSLVVESLRHNNSIPILIN
jgi:L,D-transpeptidase ErfK/SrfK